MEINYRKGERGRKEGRDGRKGKERRGPHKLRIAAHVCSQQEIMSHQIAQSIQRVLD